jgi:hypothetical protein
MPSTSAKQERFMRAVAHSPKFAKKVGVPQSVGKEFEMKNMEGKMMKKEGRGMAKADMQKSGMKGYEKGGKVHSDVKMDKAMMEKMVKKHADKPASKAHKGLKMGGSVSASKMGAVKTAKPSMGSASKRADGVAMKGKTKGMMMRKGGMC